MNSSELNQNASKLPRDHQSRAIRSVGDVRLRIPPSSLQNPDEHDDFSQPPRSHKALHTSIASHTLRQSKILRRNSIGYKHALRYPIPPIPDFVELTEAVCELLLRMAFRRTSIFSPACCSRPIHAPGSNYRVIHKTISAHSITPARLRHQEIVQSFPKRTIIGTTKGSRGTRGFELDSGKICRRLTFLTRPLPASRGPVFRLLYRFFAFAGGFVLITGSLTLAFFIYDASTYRQDLSFTDIAVSEEALYPRRGGPKNLPIADVLVDDDDCEDNRNKKQKPKLVILGSGWGSVALLKKLNIHDYHVTVVSPVNYFLFTPMLPSATVGTLELRSLCEPIRRIVQRVKGHFLRAEAVDIEFSDRLLEIRQKDASGTERHFYLPYDKLVIGVGTVAHKFKVERLYSLDF